MSTSLNTMAAEMETGKSLNNTKQCSVMPYIYKNCDQGYAYEKKTCVFFFTNVDTIIVSVDCKLQKLQKL